MKSTSNTYKQIIASGDTRKFVVRVDMTLADNTSLTITDATIMEGSFKILTASSGTDSFDIGSAIIGKCEFTLLNYDDRYTEYDFFNATATVWVGLVGDLDGNDNQIYTRMGFFTVDEPSFAGSLVSLELLDNMWKFDVPVSEVNLTFPISAISAVQDICSYCGVILATQTFHGSSFVISEAPDSIDSMNCRELLQYIAMLGCNFCVIDNTGALRIRWYETPTSSESNLDGGTFSTNTTPYSDGDSADGGNFTTYTGGTSYDGGGFIEENVDAFTRLMSRTIGTDDLTITGVKFVLDEVEHTIGTTGYVLVLENPLVNEGNVNSVLNLIWDVLEGFTIRTFNVTALADLAPEVGDCCALSYKGSMVYSYLTNYTFSPSLATASLGAVSPTRTLTRRYSKTVQATIEEARKQAVNVVSDYDVAVQMMNNLAVNAMGAYQDYEDLSTGGRVYFLSNSPITKTGGHCSFTSGSTVFKLSGDGFFVSTDGGTTWTNGYNSQTGQLVVNVINAIGLQAEWIKTGTLDVGGNGTNAVIRVKDSQGNPICYINSQGIIMYRGLIQDATGLNYWNLSTGAFSLASSVKVNIQTPDYTGTVDPTLSNYPASSWTDYDDHVGETYKNTVSSDCFVFKKNENGGSLKIKFSDECATENNYDYVEIYYVKNGTYYKRVFTGSFGGAEVYIPTATFFLLWHTDSSVNNYGWSIDSFEVVDYQEPTGFSATSAPSASEQVLVPGTSTQTQSEHPYTANIDRLYVWETQLSLTYCWAESTLDEYSRSISELIVGGDLTQEEVFNALTNNGADQCIKMDGYGHLYVNAEYVGVGVLRIGGINYAQNAHIEVRDTSDNVVGTWDKDGFSANRGSFGRLVIDSSDSSMYVLGYSQFYRSTTRSAVTAASATVNGKIPSYVTSFNIKTTFTGTVASGQSYADGTQAGTVNIQRSSGGSYSTIETLAIKFNEEVESSTSISYSDLQNYSYRVVVTLNNVTTYLSSCARAVVTSNYKIFNINETGVRGNLEGAFTGTAILTDVDIGASGHYDDTNDWLSFGALGSNYSTFGKYGFSCSGSISDTYDLWGAHVLNNRPVPSISTDNECFFVGGYKSSSVGRYHVMSERCLRYVYNSNIYDYQYSSSDERTKNDIKDLPVELSVGLIDETQPKSFRYNGDEELKHYGMIAQDARAILDNLGEDDAGLEYSMGDTNIPDQRNIVYQEYIPHLINYVKDLRKELDAVKAELKELKGE